MIVHAPAQESDGVCVVSGQLQRFAPRAGDWDAIGPVLPDPLGVQQQEYLRRDRLAAQAWQRVFPKVAASAEPMARQGLLGVVINGH
jgi:hypothetical protein